MTIESKFVVDIRAIRGCEGKALGLEWTFVKKVHKIGWTVKDKFGDSEWHGDRATR